jgi:hypothetical protein
VWRDLVIRVIEVFAAGAALKGDVAAALLVERRRGAPVPVEARGQIVQAG